MNLELDKELLDRIAKSTDREWLSHIQRHYYADAQISLMYADGQNCWQKDYEEETAYGNACNDRLHDLRLAEDGDNK